MMRDFCLATTLSIWGELLKTLGTGSAETGYGAYTAVTKRIVPTVNFAGNGPFVVLLR